MSAAYSPFALSAAVTPHHVDIVSGSFGAGHDVAAEAIAEQLHARGFSTRTWDVVDLMPGHLGRMLRSGYLKQIQSMPATWRWTLGAIDRHDSVTRGIERALRTTESALLDIAAGGPSHFVSTHPFPSQALGHLRATGRLSVPVTTYLTDMSVHRLWVHPGVDTHLAVHDIPARQARRLGAGETRVVNPAIRAAFATTTRTGHGQVVARRALGLPDDRRHLALVTGGAHGIGQLFQSACDLAATGLVTPVVLCGTNRRLLARVDRHPSMIGLGWVADMPRLLEAVDVVVQNSGGMTSLETRAAAVPMVTYRCIAGHGETNASALDVAGLAPWVHDPEQLRRAIFAALQVQAVLPGNRWSGSDVVDALFQLSSLSA
ncbi:MAG: processive 1,2-diacylglycerol beta-glucosyltransferase [Nocardioidaceae bacterium]|jgi:UDP-N-acetylglucosamine:LPS N-acetylglucosamine transferase|nr:processive 1,2-diacylglycerol beta-glucosyltransferase [Nocardioidaceae bacterium]